MKYLRILNWLLIPRAIYLPKASNPNQEMGYIIFGFHWFSCAICNKEGMSKPARNICSSYKCFDAYRNKAKETNIVKG